MSIFRLSVLLTIALSALSTQAQGDEAPAPGLEPTDPVVQTDNLTPLGPLDEAEKDVREIYTKFFRRTRNPRMHAQGWD